MTLYFYHFPIGTIHPSSPTIIKAAVALELKGEKDVVEKLYRNEFDYKVTDTAEVLKNFNQFMKTDLMLKDIESMKVQHHVKEDLELAAQLMVRGTPSVFIDGVKDNGHELFEKLKAEYKK